MSHARSLRSGSSSGFTLMEVLLALSLSTIVLGALAMAIHFHLRVVDTGRQEVEQAQLARAILAKIAGDLRIAMYYEPLDTSAMIPPSATATALSSAISGAMGSAGASQGGTGGSSSSGSGAGSVLSSGSSSGPPSSGGGGAQGSGGSSGSGPPSGGGSRGGGAQGSGGSSGSGPPAGGGNGGQQGSGSSSSASGSTTSTGAATTEDIAGTEEVPPVPGLYGTQYELQIDISRLPRVDQYAGLVTDATTAATSTDRVSDVKTVAYYVVASGSAGVGSAGVGSAGIGSAAGATGYGLVRRELDRAATQYSTTSGGYAELDQHVELLAPEVMGLEFAYYDGTEWVTEWDSTARKGLPMAVEISLQVATQQMIAQMAPEDYPTYKLLVHLLAGKPTTLEETTTTETESGEGTGATGSSSSSTSGASGSSSSGGSSTSGSGS